MTGTLLPDKSRWEYLHSGMYAFNHLLCHWFSLFACQRLCQWSIFYRNFLSIWKLLSQRSRSKYLYVGVDMSCKKVRCAVAMWGLVFLIGMAKWKRYVWESRLTSMLCWVANSCTSLKGSSMLRYVYTIQSLPSPPFSLFLSLSPFALSSFLFLSHTYVDIAV